MPKPVKKAAKKATGTLPVPPKGKRPSDPMRAAQAILGEHMARLDPAPPQGDPFKAQLSAYMSKLGKKGGDASGKARMTSLSAGQRREIAAAAARARWKKAKTKRKKSDR